MERWSKEAKDTHSWTDGKLLEGSIADGPPPGTNHRPAMAVFCSKCGLKAYRELTDAEKELYRQDLLPFEERTAHQSDIDSDRWWSSRPCPLDREPTLTDIAREVARRIDASDQEAVKLAPDLLRKLAELYEKATEQSVFMKTELLNLWKTR